MLLDVIISEHLLTISPTLDVVRYYFGMISFIYSPVFSPSMFYYSHRYVLGNISSEHLLTVSPTC